MTKSHIAKPQKLKYLESGFYKDSRAKEWRCRLHQDSVKKYKGRLKELTCRRIPGTVTGKIEKINQVREEYEDVAVVCYINSTAELKTYSDVCVTSSNALKIVKALPNHHIFFIPDEHLGRYVASQAPEKHFIFNDGCAVSDIVHPPQFVLLSITFKCLNCSCIFVATILNVANSS